MPAVYSRPERTNRLGTETAYAVSLEASQLKAKGKTIYPFHIGDLNFSTPQVVIDAAKKSLDAGKTGYCPAAGIPELRKALAQRIGGDRGIEYTMENVSVQPGGKPVIGKFLLSVVEDGEEVLYPSPGYPIYESLIDYHGGVPKAYTYIDTGSEFKIDIDQIRSLITPKTKVLIYNNPSNPMGALSSPEEMQALADLCIQHDLWVLSDEPYFDIVYDDAKFEHRSIASLPGMQDRTVILYTFSKNYAMTGWRVGAAIGPKEVIDQITKLNTNMEACTSHFLQHASVECLEKRKQTDQFLFDMLAELKDRRDLLVKLVNEVPGFSCFTPPSTFYLCVKVTKAMDMLGFKNIEDFRRSILAETGVSFCTREHFGEAQSFDTDHYVRFAYSSASQETIKTALTVLKDYMTSKTQ
ncbi:unnamed protein product [Vitrella brassicaformis CCMP3155]|uniref:Aminotransferase class I/classII large domain-containing protein n=2 Tax=Vitrella brassicaformis TaxID=1169539 RepID=A0A0G4F437_VITBC|nr:unnamed protein product [Vitrella brassicaformis CCMP3155]|mmetsp:Transcript_44701/g.111164  ORF Transcript_44701/g.111164 Transcript_44701/m.111164 type:complete len:411 (+) Transcript_44701:194-1426(+)|eukprot:CEM06785.1 unnamed protein product [Vitrella brassicaformis CCMP3155]